MISWPNKLVTNETVSGIKLTYTVNVDSTAAVKLSPSAGTRLIMIYNESTTDKAYIGPSGVTTTTGIPIYPEGIVVIPIQGDPGIYLIADAALTLRVLEAE